MGWETWAQNQRSPDHRKPTLPILAIAILIIVISESSPSGCISWRSADPWPGWGQNKRAPLEIKCRGRGIPDLNQTNPPTPFEDQERERVLRISSVYIYIQYNVFDLGVKEPTVVLDRFNQFWQEQPPGVNRLLKKRHTIKSNHNNCPTKRTIQAEHHYDTHMFSWHSECNVLRQSACVWSPYPKARIYGKPKEPPVGRILCQDQLW